MTRDVAQNTDHEERLNEVLLAYVEDIEAGRTPDRQRLLADHPDLQEDLQSFFNDRDEIDRLAAPLRQTAERSGDPNSTKVTSRSELQFFRENVGHRDDPDGELGLLGDFRILRQVGRGGMGVVYEAHQISLRRRVALKVLPFASAIDERQLQRFKNEALAAAHLQHPNIVPVYAVGCERGVHYYAMQFIEGQSLAELIADLRKEKSLPGDHSDHLAATSIENSGSFSSLSLTRTRAGGNQSHCDWVARLGRQAALALEHAHQTGIVHRDVKPSNLLLDMQGQVWVTDFGLAQVRGDNGLTGTGEVLGTLRYASPEQAMARRGIVDHRSDIYSLGATLYELLTLRPVFDGRDRVELLRQIADNEPVLPRTIASTIPEDLETIILKALRKEPAERYVTAEDLAADLQRYLGHQPIQARRPTLVERVRKWGRRHPSVVASGLFVLMALTVGSMVSAGLIRMEQARTSSARKAAEQAYERERARADEAESRFRLARRSVDEMIRFSEEELAHRPAMEGLRKRLLQSALASYQEFVTERRDDPHAQAELVDTTQRIEGILADLEVLRSSRHFYLLSQPSVLDDLCQDPQQRSQIQVLAGQIGHQWWESMREFRRFSPTERGRRTLQRARANEAALTSILNPTQKRRIHQIAWQLEGIGVFQEPDIVSELDLTPRQRERMREIEDKAAFDRIRFSENQKPQEETEKPSPMPRALEVLTPKQRQKWENLIGKPFTGKVPFGPFNRRGGPPGSGS